MEQYLQSIIGLCAMIQNKDYEDQDELISMLDSISDDAKAAIVSIEEIEK